jgi:haloalkane dehalogenase
MAIEQTDLGPKAISAEFPFESRYIDVHGSRMHYIEEGTGEPILFLHGNPTSNYLWRNIIPHISGLGRCIAPDLIGMGRSDRPNIGYTYADHARYVDGFIQAMGIGENLTLVIHDWGSMLGFLWAAQNPDRVRAVAFMEAALRPLSIKDMPGSLAMAFRLMRAPVTGWLMSGVGNIMINKMLPDLTHAKMSKEVHQTYKDAFPTVRSRRAVIQFPREVPLDGKPAASLKAVETYVEWLKSTDVPKLMFHGGGGVAIKEAEVQWSRQHLSNLTLCDLGEAKHFVQESHPHKIGQEISRWMATLS